MNSKKLRKLSMGNDLIQYEGKQNQGFLAECNEASQEALEKAAQEKGLTVAQFVAKYGPVNTANLAFHTSALIIEFAKRSGPGSTIHMPAYFTPAMDLVSTIPETIYDGLNTDTWTKAINKL